MTSAIGSSSCPTRSLAERRSEVLPFAVVGLACLVAGGLVAAATAPAPSEHGTWAAAYLVLVGGVAQAGLGLGQATFAAHLSARIIAAEVIGWNVGNAAVLAGAPLGSTALVDLGGVLLVVTLGLLARGLRPAKLQAAPALHRWYLFGYRLLVLVLLVSVPVGLALARIRA